MQPKYLGQYRFRKAKRVGLLELDFPKYIPLVTATLILLGVSKLMFYYDYFGVTIISYLDFGEIITSFLDTVVAQLL